MNQFFRNCWWKRQDDFGYDLDHYLAFRYPGHLCWRNDCQGRFTFVVSTQNCTLQKCQCAKLPFKASFFTVFPVFSLFANYMLARLKCILIVELHNRWYWEMVSSVGVAKAESQGAAEVSDVASISTLGWFPIIFENIDFFVELVSWKVQAIVNTCLSNYFFQCNQYNHNIFGTVKLLLSYLGLRLCLDKA